MGEEELLAALQDFIRRWNVPVTNAYSLTSLRQHGRNAQPGNVDYRGQFNRLKRDLTQSGLADRVFQRFRGVVVPATRKEVAEEAKRDARLVKQVKAQKTAAAKVDEFLQRWGGYGSTSVTPQKGGAEGASLLEWGQQRHALNLPEFEAGFKDVTRLVGLGGEQDALAMMQNLANRDRHKINWLAKPYDFRGEAPPDPEALEAGVRLVEKRTADRARRVGIIPKGYKSPLLPGGRQLGWAINDEVRKDLGRVWGLGDSLDAIGAPTVVKAGDQTAAGLVYVGDPAAAEGRAYMRFAIERQQLMETEDPSLVYKALITLQDRAEKTTMFDTGPAERYMVSGQQPTYDTVQQIMRQRDIFKGVAAEPSAKPYSMVFDLETMSLQPEHGIREISARFIDDAGKEVKAAMNIHLQHGLHGLGVHGRPLHEVFGIQPDQLRPQSEYVQRVTEFFEAANEAKFVVAQNNNFDIGMLARVKDDAMYDLGMNLIKRSRTATGPEEEMAVRLAKSANLFFEGVGTDRYVDTSAHLKILMSKLEGRTVSVAEELAHLGEMKQYSVANIMLQTSALEDILHHGLATPAEVAEQMEGALHSGFVDTWWTKHLFTLIKKGEAGEDVLRPTELGDRAVELLNQGRAAGELLTRTGVREKFIQGSAYTVTATHLPAKDLMELERAGILSEAERRVAKITPMEQLMLLQRHATYDPLSKQWKKISEGQEAAGRPLAGNADLNKIDALKVRGKWDEFATKHRLLLESGRINPMGDFDTAKAEYGALQKEFADAGAPFARLSMVERMMSAALGRSEVPGLSAAENQVRRAIGEVAPVLYWQTYSGLPGQKAVTTWGVNAAVAPELLERAGLMDKESLMGWSAFQPSTYGPKDFALTVNAISPDKVKGEEQIKKLLGFLSGTAEGGLTPGEQEAYGITEDVLGKLGKALTATGATAGIQIGTMGGGKGTDEARAAYEAFDSVDATVDRTTHKWLLGRVGEIVEGLGGEKYLRSTAFLSAAGGVLERDKTDLAEGAQHLAHATEEAYKRISGDPRLLAELGEKPRAGGPLADFFVNAYKKAQPHLTGKRLGIAAGIGVAAALFYKASRPKPAEEVMQQMPFEDPNFYGRYRAEAGQPYKEPIAMINQPQDPLGTAHLPGYLNDNKTRHHEMNTSTKNRHLYAGAY